MEFKVYNYTGVKSDVQIVNISRRGMNTPAITETISQGGYETFSMGPDSRRDVYSVMVKSVNDTAYQVYGNFRLESSAVGDTPTLVLAVDRFGRGDVAMDFTRSGEHIKYFAKCESRELKFALRLTEDEWEDLVEDQPSSIYGLVCRARGLSIRNMDGSEPIRCGFPLGMTIFWSILAIILIVLVVVIIVAVMIAVARKIYRSR